MAFSWSEVTLLLPPPPGACVLEDDKGGSQSSLPVLGGIPPFAWSIVGVDISL